MGAAAGGAGTAGSILAPLFGLPIAGGIAGLLGAKGVPGDNMFKDIGGTANISSNAATAASQQQAQAAGLQQTLLTQPKTISPDNFLATKASQLANLRLGLASTVTGAGGAPGAVLGSTSLTGSGPGKLKLGQ